MVWWSACFPSIQIIEVQIPFEGKSLLFIFIFIAPLQSQWLLMGSPMLMNPHLSQQDIGLQYKVF